MRIIVTRMGHGAQSIILFYEGDVQMMDDEDVHKFVEFQFPA